MMASLEPMVEVPMADDDGAWNRFEMMLTQRDCSSAVCGYCS